jgi:DHA2 family multidrug resistance protein-like MFS transporter
MSSVPVRRAGLGSAINNAVSRVGAPLMSAILFIAITASFYPLLESRVPGLTAGDVRALEIQPLASVPDGTDEALATAAREASTDAFHLAMLVSALLLFVGAAVNGIGIRNPTAEGAPPVADAAPAAG